MDCNVFDRVEKKCLITKRQKQNILHSIRQNMQEDKFYKSEVFNVYFDTDNYDLIIQSIDQPAFKEKLRARSYGGYDKVFFEIKTKLKGHDYNVGYKRRVCITKKDYQKIAKGRTNLTELTKQRLDAPHDRQIAKEVDYLFEHFSLHPKILVFYKRESYQGENNLRITFDENLKYRTEQITFSKKKLDKPFFNHEKNIIMEIKAHEVLPLWLVKELSKEKIFPQRFSKVGNIYQKIRKEEDVQ